MTRRVVYEYSCDRRGCRNGLVREGTLSEAERCARAQGWQIGPQRRARCPEHPTKGTR